MSGANEVLYAEERRGRIAALVKEQRKVTVSALCQLFGVSAATIRADLREMQQAGLLKRTHGGAILKGQTAAELIANQKTDHDVPQKRRIAEAALALIEDGDTLLLDTGTTTLELARRLSQRRNLKVVTNDIEIARLLEDTDCGEVILLGGILRKGFHCTVVRAALAAQVDLTVDKAFMGANGFSVEKGATTPDVQQAETKKAMVAMSNQVILLCDSSKIGRVSFMRFAPADAVDVLVTDSLDAETETRLRELGVELVIA